MLDEEMVEITMSIPKTHWFPYEAGQYVLLQVPQVSFFQWHPFTISTVSDDEAQVHIKADGNWTQRLRDFGKEGEELTHVGIDGPFGVSSIVDKTMPSSTDIPCRLRPNAFTTSITSLS